MTEKINFAKLLKKKYLAHFKDSMETDGFTRKIC